MDQEKFYKSFSPKYHCLCLTMNFQLNQIIKFPRVSIWTSPDKEYRMQIDSNFEISCECSKSYISENDIIIINEVYELQP